MNRRNDVEGSGRGQPAVGPTVPVSVWSTEKHTEIHVFWAQCYIWQDQTLTEYKSGTPTLEPGCLQYS